VLNVIPPQRAGDIARSAGLLNMNNRWVGVNWLTMESTAAPGVHVLGDATFPAPLMPKSGHMANQHAKVAAAAIIQLLQGQPVNQTPVVMNTCYSFVTAKDVVHVASVHQYDAKDKTFKTVAGLRRRQCRGQPDRRPLRAELGRQHLGRRAGAVDPARGRA
jgi:sulfide dehydrogenase [flavocytochrome c] flavoprotein subunit